MAQTKTKKIMPIGGRILVQRVEEKEVKKGGIIIPDTAKEKPQQGKVIEVSKMPGSTEEPAVKKGDIVLFGKYAGTEVEFEGEEYIIMEINDILGVIK